MTTTTTTTDATIETSAADTDRLYKHVVLDKNSLQVLLISDPTTEKSSVALDVNIGSYSDNLGGEAHFLEHMLFMGTKKYPNENEYSVYLNQHGGSSNAYTDLEHTNYYLDVQTDHFEGALDRFAQFFIEPLLNKESLEKERNAVDSEHAKNLQSDMWRTYQLLKSLSREDHPFSKFGTGNQESLQQVTHETLWDFYETHYSANRMSLVLLGKESLDELEALAGLYFEDIPNRNLEPNVFPGAPFQGITPLSLQVTPVQQAMTLELYFPMMAVEQLYLSKPTRILSHLIGHESQGSLFALFKEKQWAHDLSAGTSRSNSDWSSFGITVTLTEQGYAHVHDMVQLVFQYIQHVVPQAPAWVYDECKTVADCTFRFLSKRDAMDYTSSLATNLHQYPPHHVLSGDYRFYDTDYDPKLMTKCLEYMTPQNLVLLVSHPKEELPAPVETEKWYGVQYHKSTIADDLLTQWTNTTADASLHLPERNDMIATNFDLVEAATDQDTYKDGPVLLQDSPVCRVWYKPDTKFNMPKLQLLLQIVTPVAYESPTSQVMTHLFQMALEDSCNDFSYLASMAGLQCQFATTRTGLDIHVSGYSDKVHVLVQRIVDTVTNLDISTEVLHRLTSKLAQDLENFQFAPAYQHAMYGADVVLLEHKWSPTDKLAALQHVSSPQQLLDFAKTQLWKRCHLDVLVHGNVTTDQATQLAQLWVDGLKPEPLFGLPDDRVVQLPRGQTTTLEFAGFNADNTNSVIEVVYQLSNLSLADRATLALLAHILKEPAFHQLRTEQQLGYIVHTSIHTSGGCIKGLLLLIQSDSYDPIHMDQCIAEFMNGLRSYLSSMSPDDFQKQVAAVVQNLREAPKNLLQESTRYWDAIQKRHYSFQRLHEISCFVQELEALNVLQFYDKHFSNSGSAAKLSVQVFGSNHVEKMTTQSTSSVTLETALELKRTLPLFALAPTVQVKDRLVMK